jgi:hypothetical protein
VCAVKRFELSDCLLPSAFEIRPSVAHRFTSSTTLAHSPAHTPPFSSVPGSPTLGIWHFDNLFREFKSANGIGNPIPSRIPSKTHPFPELPTTSLDTTLATLQHSHITKKLRHSDLRVCTDSSRSHYTSTFSFRKPLSVDIKTNIKCKTKKSYFPETEQPQGFPYKLQEFRLYS